MLLIGIAATTALVSAMDWRDAALESLTWRHRAAYESSLVITTSDESYDGRQVHIQARMCIDSLNTRYTRVADTAFYDKDGAALGDTISQIEALGDVYYVRSNNGVIDLHRNRAEAWTTFLSHPDGDGFLDGYLLGNMGMHIYELLDRNNVNSDVRSADTLAVRGECMFGKIAIEVDPSQRYRLTEYSITKSPEDYFDSITLKASKPLVSMPDQVQWNARVHNLRYCDVEGYHVPIAGTLTLTQTYSNGEIVAIEYNARRSQITLNGDCEDPATLIPHGVKVLDRERPSWPYTWDVDRPVLSWNKDVIHDIDDTVLRFQQQRDAPAFGGTVQKNDSGNVMCGLYCLYAATILLERDVSFESILAGLEEPEPSGVTIEQLQSAAVSLGIGVISEGGLLPSDLHALNAPAVLYTRLRESSEEADHFILLLDTNSTGAVVFEPPTQYRGASIHEMSFIRLAAIWNGSAVTLCDGVCDKSNTLALSRIRRWLTICAVAAAALAVLRILSGMLCGLAARLASVCIITAGSATIWHGGVTGLLSGEAFALAGNVADKLYVGTISLEEYSVLAAHDTVALVDARAREEYDSRRMPGARHLAYNATHSERQAALRDIGLSDRIVIYCNPSGCPLAAILARMLRHDGYANVQTLEGRWDRWMEER